MSQAARIGDQHFCPKVEPGPKPHVGGPIIQGEPTVLIEGQPAARVGDQATCMAPPDTISRGAFPVLIGGKPAARLGDPTVHGGVITAGAATVFIGTAGISGNPWVGEKVFKGMASGRVSGSVQQSYGNCGVESSRQIINHATGGKVSENQLLTQAFNNGWAAVDETQAQTGGTSPAQRQSILASQNVKSSLQPQNMESIELAVANQKGVITSNDAGKLWNNPEFDGSGHAVVVTGVEYDQNGNLVNVVINDTGSGQGKQSIPAQRFQNSLRAKRDINVTDNPIW